VIGCADRVTGRGTVYIFVTIVLALLIAGFGLGVALGLRMPAGTDE